MKSKNMRPLILGHRRGVVTVGTSSPARPPGNQQTAGNDAALEGNGVGGMSRGAFVVRNPPPQAVINPIRSMESSNNSSVGHFVGCSDELSSSPSPPAVGGGGGSGPVLLLFDRPSARQKNLPLDLSGITSMRASGRSDGPHSSTSCEAKTGSSSHLFRRSKDDTTASIRRAAGGAQLPVVSSSAPSSARSVPRNKFVTDINEFASPPARGGAKGKKAMSAGSRRRSTNLLETPDEFDRYNPFPQKKATRIPIIVDEGWWGEEGSSSTSRLPIAQTQVSSKSEADQTDTKPQAPLSASAGRSRFLRSNSCF